MESRRIPWSSFARAMAVLQIISVAFVILTVASLHHFYHVGYVLDADEEDHCRKFHTTSMKNGYADYDLTALHDRVEEVLARISEIQNKLRSSLKNMDKDDAAQTEFRIFLEEQVMQPLYSAHLALTLVRIVPKSLELPVEDPLIDFFTVEETRKYIAGKGNKEGKSSVFGTDKTYNTIGHACVLMRKELEEYMDYDKGSYCKDDWNLAQKLMLGGCDPLPRRRCLAPASKLFQKPLPIDTSLWTMPDDHNVRWSNYKCRDFKCLSSRNRRRGFSRCSRCFDFEKEKRRWVVANGSSSLAEFLISDVLAVKPGEIRIGLDVSVGTGSFAARMRERNVTIVSTSMNLGAPFSETIALRGLIPLYATLNQRLPFFDNTMDLIHSGELLDGWIDLQLLDFILFDWDRVLRPGGLLWLDKLFCSREDVDDYVYMFLQFKYKKHKWVISFKSEDEVYISALLEKPPRSL